MLFMLRTGVMIVIAYALNNSNMPIWQVFYIGVITGILLFKALPLLLERYTFYR